MSTSATDPSASPPATENAASEGSGYNTKAAVPRRQRIPRACDACRRKKIRCNLSQTIADSPAAEALGQQDAAGGGNQKCQNCKQSGTPCLFTKTPAKRGPSKGYIQQLESRLAALESSTNIDHSHVPGNTLPPMAPYSGVRKDPSDITSTSAGPTKKARVVGGLPAVKTAVKTPIDSSNTVTPQSHSRYSPNSDKSSLPAAPAGNIPSVLCPPPTTSSSRPQSASTPSHHLVNTLGTPSLPNINTGLPANNQKSALPPISRLLSQVPATASGPQWDALASHGSVGSQHNGHPAGVRRDTALHSYHPYYSPLRQHRDLHPASAPLPRSQSPYSAGWPSYQAGGLPSGHPEDKPRAGAAVEPKPSLSRSYMSLHHSSTGDSSMSTHPINPSIRSLDKRSASSTSPTAPFHASLTRSPTPASHLGRLDRSAILSLDTPALRKALFATPAFKTFALLPSSMLDTGLGEHHELIKVAYQLANSTATMQVSNDAQWKVDVAEVIGQCMMPVTFARLGPERICRDIETLLLCYIDAIRRGRYLPGILGCISSKISDIQGRGVDCSRFKASLTLLSVWNCVGFSSRAMYYTVPKADRPDDLYEALQVSDPALRAVCIFTGALDSMCRRYTEDPSHTIPPETLELSLPAVIEHRVELPGKQARLLATLDSYLLLLNFMYNNRPSIQPPLEILERQRRHLYNILNECEACGATALALGVHVLSLSAVVAVYCLSVCRSLSSTTGLEGHRSQLCQALQRDYLNILDTLKNILTALSTPPDSAVFINHPFADSGDYRILYSIVASYVKLHVSAAAQGRHELLHADDVLLSFNFSGYIGHIVGTIEDQEIQQAR